MMEQWIYTMVKYYVVGKIGTMLLDDILTSVASLLGQMPHCRAIDNIEHYIRKIYEEKIKNIKRFDSDL